MVTLYFADGADLFPVSRRMPAGGDLPRAALQALIDGPDSETQLTRSVPRGVHIRSFKLIDSVAQIDLSSSFLQERSGASMAQIAVIDTMTALPGITAVTLSVEGNPLAEAARHMPLLYYASANGLVAVPATARDPRTALTAYLSRTEDNRITSFPADVHLLDYEYDAADRLLSLNFTYSPSIRMLALDRPERMRLLLLGLITTLTEFPEVKAVRLDFEGQSRLGLGQCSDLLRTPQPHPQLLNDERLLGR
jgi:spore germination protein GerM